MPFVLYGLVSLFRNSDSYFCIRMNIDVKILEVVYIILFSKIINVEEKLTITLRKVWRQRERESEREREIYGDGEKS